MGARRLADSFACIAGFIFVPAVASATEDAPSHLRRAGVEAFLPYSIGNVRGLDASRILGTYRWNGLPVLGQTREAAAATERFDVLAGLAALEAGAIVPGGVVERLDKKAEPGARAATLRLDAGVRNRSMKEVGADAAIVTPAVGWRITARGERGETALPGTHYAGEYASVAATLKPTPALEVTGSFELAHGDERGEQASIYLNGLAAPPAPPAGTLLGQTWDGSEIRDRVASVRFRLSTGETWALSGGVLRMDQRHREADFVGMLQPDGRYALDYFFDPAQRLVSDTLHAQLDGSARTGSVVHRLSFGVSHLQSRTLTAGTASAALGVTSLYAPAQFPPVTLAPPGPQYESERLVDSSVFVSDALGFGGRWTVLASLRGGQYRQDGANVVSPVEEAYLLRGLGVRYVMNRRLTLYASYGEALERGGTAPLLAANALRVLPVFRSTQYETGARIAVSERLSVEGALFEARRRYEYEDAARVYRQDGIVHHRGAELRVVGAAGDVRLYGNLLLLDARVHGASDAAVDGTRALDVPPRRARFIAETPLPWGAGWSASANLEAVSARPADAIGFARIPGYGIVGVGLAYDWPGRAGTTLRIDVENVANKGYWSDAAGSYLYPGDPRTVFVRLALSL